MRFRSGARHLCYTVHKRVDDSLLLPRRDSSRRGDDRGRLALRAEGESVRTFRSLRAQLNAIFLGFLILTGASVAATYSATQAQTDDARVINLAGRQRMLTQKMVWLALAQPDSDELDAAIQQFDRTLIALRDGGSTLDAMNRVVALPPVSDPAVRAQLDSVARAWTNFRRHLSPVDSVALQAQAALILSQIDDAVSALEAQAHGGMKVR